MDNALLAAMELARRHARWAQTEGADRLYDAIAELLLFRAHEPMVSARRSAWY